MESNKFNMLLLIRTISSQDYIVTGFLSRPVRVQGFRLDRKVWPALKIRHIAVRKAKATPKDGPCCTLFRHKEIHPAFLEQGV